MKLAAFPSQTSFGSLDNIWGMRVSYAAMTVAGEIQKFLNFGQTTFDLWLDFKVHLAHVIQLKSF